MDQDLSTIWKPQPKQAIALESTVDELFYGGAKGGGKSDFMLADFLRGKQYGSKHRGILFRRTYKEFEELQNRAREIYPRIGARYLKGERLWSFPGGATLKMRHLDRDEDVHLYQGHQYTWVGFDELTEWPNDKCYIFMFSCARSPHGIPVRIRATGNPGRIGHVWVKHRFIEEKVPMNVYYDPETEMYRTFIPAKLEDNPALMKNDPGYEKRLKALPRHLYRAFREGDWDVFAGQAFEEIRRDLHFIRPIPLHPSWIRFCSFDWGYARPYSIGWWTKTNEGRLIRYREMYGCEKGKRDVGLKKSSKELAQEAWNISVAEGCDTMVADPSIWAKSDEGPSIAENFEAVGWKMIKGNNDRKSGIAKVHDYLKTIGSDGKPMMMIFENCHAWIRTMPVLVVDDDDPEDIADGQEDHAYDETRYAVLSDFTRADRRVIEPVEMFEDSGGLENYDILGRK